MSQSPNRGFKIFVEYGFVVFFAGVGGLEHEIEIQVILPTPALASRKEFW